jgi:hypothetical protein
MATLRIFQFLTLGALAVGLGGCTSTISGDSPGGTRVSRPVLPSISASQRVVEDYLKAASTGDGARMYGLIASSERERESPTTLGKTAADRYSPSTKWEVLKTRETGSTSEVVVDMKGAKVEPNPTKFTLTRESGEWRIVDSPELHEREKNGDLHIKF